MRKVKEIIKENKLAMEKATTPAEKENRKEYDCWLRQRYSNRDVDADEEKLQENFKKFMDLKRTIFNK